MTAHAEAHSPETAHAQFGDESEERLKAAAALKFEPSEVRDFEMADRAAGEMMGKLLAFLFCVLLFLMTGVNIWMMNHKSQGTDPQAPLTNPSAIEDHAAAKLH